MSPKNGSPCLQINFPLDPTIYKCHTHERGVETPKAPTGLTGLWQSPGHSEGAMCQLSAQQGAVYLTLKPRERLWYCEALCHPLCNVI